MPWNVSSPMSQRADFIRDLEQGLFTFSDLCAHYGVSRKTGYKWRARFLQEGSPGLADRKRRPKHCPHATLAEIQDRVVSVRKAHPFWGPRKVKAWLERRFPRTPWPAASTIGDLLKRAHLVRPRRRRTPPGHPGKPLTVPEQPNHIWTVDFKGEFLTADGVYCYPLTVVDSFSRYLLGCQALPAIALPFVQPVFTRLFSEFGLPTLIRSDNGVPFATQAILRLSKLQVWWLHLGIRTELIEPARPQQNGRHERFHRTLKAETARPPAGSLHAQQRAFNRFRFIYNAERPHEALDMDVPAHHYRRSARVFPERLPDFHYPAHFELRRVSRDGAIRWNNGLLNISHVLAGEDVALEDVADGIYAVHFGPLVLGRFDERLLKLSGPYPENHRR